LAQTKVGIRTIHQSTAAVGWSNGRTVTIDRTAAAGGMGIGFNGGELLLLAVGACYCNDLFREAQRLNIDVKSADIEVECDWGGEPVRANNLALTVKIQGAAPKQQLEELVRHVDRVAEIPNSLRLGTNVSLRSCEIVSELKS
jgi:organic hydroperoxide reductase OsmC/OhrA